MTDAVFNSYLKSVYGGGSAMEYFDDIPGVFGGQASYDQDIFGGADPAEILEAMDGFSFEKKLHRDTDDDTDAVSDDGDDDSASDDGDDTDDRSGGDESLGEKKDDSIIGYIQLGIHMTPIVSGASDHSGREMSDSLTSPIELDLSGASSDLSPEDIGEELRQLSL
jgi:hypothetical protein